ncbi:MAG: tetratricopeptide repeat protein, partial [Planctomycetes bacterium]|nr:tetratricopeptide repeat protein [Planctomycetota bacterium]
SIVRASKQQWATYHLARGDVKTATQLMEQVVASSRELGPVNQAEAWAYLAGAYFDLEQFDRSATAFEQSIVLTPRDDRYRRGAASAWYAAQRFQEALKHLQAIDPKSLADWSQLAECILEIQRRQKPDEQLWKIFDDAIANTRRIRARGAEESAEPWRGEMVAIESKLERVTPQQLDDTKASCAEELIKLCENYPKSDELKRRSIIRLRSWGMEPLATSLITDIEKRVGDSTEALLANADVLLMKGQSQEAKQLLEQGLKKDPENRLLRRALQSSSTTREPSLELKESELEALSVPQLKNLCEIALNRPLATKQEDLEDKENLEKLFTVWDDEVARFEKQLRKMEGETGTEWRYIRARRLLAKSSIDPDLDLSEAVEIGGYLDRQRPQWSSTHTLLGTVADLQKNPTQAIREYTRAIQLGAQDLRIFERLAELLYQQGMITEANALIDRLGSRASVSRRLSSIALTLSSNRESDLLSLAKEGTELRPKDPMSWIWYSQVLESSSRGASASDRSKSLEDARISIDRAKEVA